MTSNMFRLLASLTILTGQAFASPISARQEGTEGVAFGHPNESMLKPLRHLHSGH